MSWRCPRCGREVDVSFPGGEPLVQLTAGRFFFVPRPGDTQSMEFAGQAHALVCRRCDITLWPALQRLLPRRWGRNDQEDGGGPASGEEATG